MYIKLNNDLEVDFNAYFRYKKEQNIIYRGAGHRCDNDKYASLVRSKDYLPLDIRGVGDKYELIIRVEGLLSRDDRKGIRVSPGSKLGTIHDINFLVKDNRLFVIINFDDSSSSKPSSKPSSKIQHEDPKVYHPDELGDNEILD